MIPSFFAMYRTFGKPHPQRSTLLFWKPVKAISQAPGQVSQRLRRLACIGFPVSGISPMESQRDACDSGIVILRVFSLDVNVIHLLIDDYEIITWYWFPIFFQPKGCQNRHSYPLFRGENRRISQDFNIPIPPRVEVETVETFPKVCYHIWWTVQP